MTLFSEQFPPKDKCSQNSCEQRVERERERERVFSEQFSIVGLGGGEYILFMLYCIAKDTLPPTHTALELGKLREDPGNSCYTGKEKKVKYQKYQVTAWRYTEELFT